MLKKTLATVLCAIIAFSFAAVPALAAVEIPAAPTGLVLEYGDKLSDIALTNGFVWTSDVTVARYKLGENTFYVAYDYNNDGKYEGENIPVIVTVVCTEHSWGEYKSDGNASLFEDGTKTRICKICGDTETVADEGSAKIVVELNKLVNSSKISDGLSKVIGVLVTVVNKLISLAVGALSKV